MMRYADLEHQAAVRHLEVMGGFHLTPDDDLPSAYKTLLLLGPGEPGFWAYVQSQPEWQDGGPDPLDRWSKRVIDAWATELEGLALYPFGGPPYQPFLSWAGRTARARPGPIPLLVHDRAGLFVSFRGALALPMHVDLPAAPPSPCATCATQPCKTACPVNAFSATAYDIDACRTHLRSAEGADCLTNGCLARRACPVSQSYGRAPEQSGYHMTQFLGE